jgi:hypothetical protein
VGGVAIWNMRPKALPDSFRYLNMPKGHLSAIWNGAIMSATVCQETFLNVKEDKYRRIAAAAEQIPRSVRESSLELYFTIN